jgi:hypothetical protein
MKLNPLDKSVFFKLRCIQLTLLFVSLFMFTTDAISAPIISNLSDSECTVENPVTYVDTDITFTNGTNYSDGFIRFTIADSASADQLKLTSDADPNANGAISIFRYRCLSG